MFFIYKLQRITKKINNKAEEYSENMETAAETVIGSSLIGGPLIGGAVGWVDKGTISIRNIGLARTNGFYFRARQHDTGGI